jgi:hypothetical protein
MIISTSTLAWLVGTATLITVLAPIVLMAFWITDLVKGRLW